MTKVSLIENVLDDIYQFLPRHEYLDDSFQNMMECEHQSQGRYFQALFYIYTQILKEPCVYHVEAGICKRVDLRSSDEVVTYIFWPMHQLIHKSIDDLLLYYAICNECRKQQVKFILESQELTDGLNFPKIIVEQKKLVDVVSSLHTFYSAAENLGSNTNKALFKLISHFPNVCQLSKHRIVIADFRDGKHNQKITKGVFSNKTLPTILAEVQRCQKRFNIFPLSLRFDSGEGHAVLIVVDHVNKTIESYDPEGHTDIMVRKNFLDVLGHNLKYKVMYTTDTCTKMGIQFMEDFFEQAVGDNKFFQDRVYSFTEEYKYVGHCQLWTLVILLARIYNPDKTPLEISTKLSQHLQNNDYSEIINLFMNLIKITKL